MEAQEKPEEPTLHKKKIAFQKACWALKRAEDKLARLKKRKENLDAKVLNQEGFVSSLQLNRTLHAASVKVAEWSLGQRGAWEQRSGLKLPE